MMHSYKSKSLAAATTILPSAALAALVLAACASAATLATPTSSSSNTLPHLTRRQATIESWTPSPDFGKDVATTVTTVTTLFVVIWVVSALVSVCLLCALGYCILSYTRRQREKSRMAKERHQMEMEAWRQQQHVYGPGGPPQVQRPQPAYAYPPQSSQQETTGQQQGYGRQDGWSRG